MGVSAAPARVDRWAIDPEALLLFTLEVARDDARLFDEVLDWVAVNGKLLSVQRLRNLCRDEDDRVLAEATLTWASEHGLPLRLAPAAQSARTQDAIVLFRGIAPPAADRLDGAFAAHGLLRAPAHASGRSLPPDPRVPVNLAFRLRHLFGVGARAEVIRELLTVDAPWMEIKAAADAAGFAKRNVTEALASLAAADVATMTMTANRHRYRIDRTRWAGFLGMAKEDLPVHRAWVPLLWTLRAIVRWLHDERIAGSSDYLRASQARDLVSRLRPDLLAAGIPLADPGRRGAQYWSSFAEIVELATAPLERDDGK